MMQPVKFRCPACGHVSNIVVRVNHDSVSKDAVYSARLLLAIDNLRAISHEWPEDDETKRKSTLLVQTALDCLIKAIDNLQGVE